MKLLLLQAWSDEYLQAQIDAGGLAAKATHILPFVIWLVLGVALLAVVMSLWSMMKNPGALKNFAFGIVGIAVLAALSFVLKGNDTVPNNLVKLGADQQTYDIVGAGLLLTLILIAIGVLAIIWGGIKGLIK